MLAAVRADARGVLSRTDLRIGGIGSFYSPFPPQNPYLHHRIGEGGGEKTEFCLTSKEGYAVDPPTDNNCWDQSLGLLLTKSDCSR